MANLETDSQEVIIMSRHPEDSSSRGVGEDCLSQEQKINHRLTDDATAEDSGACVWIKSENISSEDENVQQDYSFWPTPMNEEEVTVAPDIMLFSCYYCSCQFPSRKSIGRHIKAYHSSQNISKVFGKRKKLVSEGLDPNDSDLEETSEDSDFELDGDDDEDWETPPNELPREQFSDIFLIEQTNPFSLPHPTSDPLPHISQTPVPPKVRPSATCWQVDPPHPPDYLFKGRPGLQMKMNQHEPLDYFKLFLTDDFVSKIIEDTNVNAEKILFESKASRPRISTWKLLSLGEFYIFLGLLLHMGNIVISFIRDYWRTDRGYKIPFFRDNMSRDRFEIILRCLYFNRRLTPEQPLPNDRLYKLRPILAHFNERMEIIYSPQREMSVDESMVLWRARLSFQQCIKTKRRKYSVMLYTVAEKSGLIQKIIVCPGIPNKVKTLQQSHAQCVMDRLVSNVREKSHSLFTDYLFNSLATLRNLRDRKFCCTGTLRANRSDNSSDVLGDEHRRGEMVYGNEDNICVMRWLDKRDLIAASEISALEQTHIRRGQPAVRPKAALAYIKHTGRSDCLDQLLTYTLTSRKILRWYQKIFIHILQIMIANSFEIFKKSAPRECGKKMSLKDFRLRIIESLVDEGRRFVGLEIPPIARQLQGSQLHRAFHYPQLLEYKDGPGRGGKRKQKDCRVCSARKVRKSTTVVCPDCPGTPGLCIDPCFRDYHLAQPE